MSKINPRLAECFLSRREKECVYWTSQGKTIEETSKLLQLTPCTVKFYLKNVRIKLDCKNKAHLIFKVMKFQLIDI